MKAAAPGARRRPSGAPGRVDAVGSDERLARLLPGAARRGGRSRPSSRSTATSSPFISATSASRNGGAGRGPARASIRQAGAGVDRQGRLRGGARARRLPDGTPGRAAAAGPSAACAAICSRTIATCCRICPATKRAASAASRRSSRATSRTRRSRRCRICSPSAATATACSPARPRACRQAGATHPALARAERDAHAHPARARLGGPPAGTGHGARDGSGAKSQRKAG